nr:hypothetical protein [uncultured Agathobaculum sp.]
MTIQEAIALFDAGDYKEAFVNFAKIYNESPNAQERQDIMAMLQEAYYQPNEPELRENYEKNIESLAAYPYLWEKQFADFSSLSFLLFPVSDDCYYLYDKKADRFVGEYDGITRHQMRYFFENLDHALRVEDEDNLYNLTFLFDNVRRSEDVAMDNHIYLLYHSWEPLQRVMQVGDLTPLLEHEKFVFLLGKKNFDRYPVNFKDQFGIDYGSMKLTPVRIEEVKRICYWYKHAYSGTALSCGILDASSHTVMFCAHDFHTYSTVNGSNIFRYLVGYLSNPKQPVSLSKLIHFINQSNVDICIPDLLKYLNWLQDNYAHQKQFTVIELFKGYFVYKYGEFTSFSRITPVLVFDPHIWQCNIYNEILHQFPYRITLTCMRNPITVFGRSYQYGLIGWNKFQTQYILGSDYVHAQFLSEPLKRDYWGYKFEDLKTKPEATIRGICQLLNIPFEAKLLEVEVPMTDKSGNTVRGFDQSPLHHDISQVLSDFDQIRLKIFYDPILKYYGYDQFPSVFHPMPEQLIQSLFAVPFCFESYNHICQKNAPSQEELHQWIQDVLQNYWNRNIFCPKLIPLQEDFVSPHTTNA